jgi:hypothetical protein
MNTARATIAEKERVKTFFRQSLQNSEIVLTFAAIFITIDEKIDNEQGACCK